MATPSRNTRLTTGSASASPSTRAEDGDGSRRSTRGSLRLTTETATSMTPAATRASSRRNLNASLAGAANTRDGDRTVEDLTLHTPQATSTPGASGPRTLTRGGGLNRSRSMFDLSQGSPLRTVATAVATLGVGYWASSYLPPGVSQLVTGLANSVFSSQPPLGQTRNPAEFLQAVSRGGSQLNLRNVTVGLLGLTAAASMSPSVRSTAANAGSAALRLITPSRKRKNEDEQLGASTGTASGYVGTSGKPGARLADDSGLNEDGDGSYTQGSSERNTSKRPKDAKASSAASASEGAAAADGTTAEELLRAKHERLLKQGKDLTEKLKAARDTSTPATGARATRASSLAPVSAKSKGKAKAAAAAQDSDEESKVDNDEDLSPPGFRAQFKRGDSKFAVVSLTDDQRQALQAPRANFRSTAGALIIYNTYRIPGAVSSPAPEATARQGEFERLLERNQFRDAFENARLQISSRPMRESITWGGAEVNVSVSKTNTRRSTANSGQDEGELAIKFAKASKVLYTTLVEQGLEKPE